MSSQCNVPVHPSDHYLLGTKWHNQYYVDLALSFDLHSAPCFLNLIPDTVEWILVHSYHIPALLYYLDNLITNALPPLQDLKPCLHNLSTVLAVCKQLGLPLHLGSTKALQQCLQYWDLNWILSIKLPVCQTNYWHRRA